VAGLNRRVAEAEEGLSARGSRVHGSSLLRAGSTQDRDGVKGSKVYYPAHLAQLSFQFSDLRLEVSDISKEPD
jgi:hypothetical protein